MGLHRGPVRSQMRDKIFPDAASFARVRRQVSFRASDPPLSADQKDNFAFQLDDVIPNPIHRYTQHGLH